MQPQWFSTQIWNDIRIFKLSRKIKYDSIKFATNGTYFSWNCGLIYHTCSRSYNKFKTPHPWKVSYVQPMRSSPSIFVNCYPNYLLYPNGSIWAYNRQNHGTSLNSWQSYRYFFLTTTFYSTMSNSTINKFKDNQEETEYEKVLYGFNLFEYPNVIGYLEEVEKSTTDIGPDKDAGKVKERGLVGLNVVEKLKRGDENKVPEYMPDTRQSAHKHDEDLEEQTMKNSSKPEEKSKQNIPPLELKDQKFQSQQRQDAHLHEATNQNQDNEQPHQSTTKVDQNHNISSIEQNEVSDKDYEIEFSSNVDALSGVIRTEMQPNLLSDVAMRKRVQLKKEESFFSKFSNIATFWQTESVSSTQRGTQMETRSVFQDVKGFVDNSLKFDANPLNSIKEFFKDNKLQIFSSNIKRVVPRDSLYKKIVLSNEPLFRKSYRYLHDIWEFAEKNPQVEFNKTLLNNMQHRLKELEALLAANYSNNESKTDEIGRDGLTKYPIQDFQFEFRGLMLIITHFLQEARNSIIDSRNYFWTLLDSKYQFDNLDKRGQSIYSLLELGIILESTRAEKNQAFPFIDNLNIEDFEHFHNLSVVDSLVELGNHFVPQLKSVFSMMVRITASQNISADYKNYNALVQAAVFASANVFYSVFKQSAAKSCNEFFKNVDVEKGKGLWNLMEGNLLKKFVFSTLPIMKVTHRFQIPPLVDWEQRVASLEALEENVVKRKGQVSMEAFTKIGNSMRNLLPDNYEKSKVNVKLISDFMPNSWKDLNLQIDSPWIYYFKSKAKGLISAKETKRLFPENSIPTVILFVHGGGFIAMSSDSHDIYTTDWVRKLNIPIVAVDYTKSPEATFPTQLEECWSVYNYIRNNSEQIFGCKVKIVLSGDSAGGNLITALCLKTIHEGIEKPDGLVISYPATYVTESPSPARLLGIADPLVNIAFLRICSKAYPHPKSNARVNPFLSPVIAPDEVLKCFPPVYINVGSLDPLFDDAVWLAKRLDKITGKVRLDVYDGLGHGYLAMLKVVPEVIDTNKHIIEWINALRKSFEGEIQDSVLKKLD